MSRPVVAFAAAAALVAFAARSASAQAAPDSAACAQRLSAPTADSIEIEMRLGVLPFDPARYLALSYDSLVEEGVRQFLALPRAVPTAVYDARRSTWAAPVIEGAYRAFLHRSGRFTQVRVVGGTRNAVFDRAMLDAIVSLDSSLLLPPLDTVTLNAGDSVDIRLSVSASMMWPTPTSALILSVSASIMWPTPTSTLIVRGFSDLGQMPLVRMRVPKREVTQKVVADFGNRPPPYPFGMRSAGADGSVSMQFVVGPDGRPDLRTVEILWATSSPFAKLALEALEHYRYSPLRVDGCAVPSLVIQPFDFHMKPAEPGGGPPPLPAGGR